MLFFLPPHPHSFASLLPKCPQALPPLCCSRPTRLWPSLSIRLAEQTRLLMRNAKGTTVLRIPIPPRFVVPRLLRCCRPRRHVLVPAIPPAEPAAPRSPCAAIPFPDARAGPAYASNHFPSAKESEN